MKHLLAILFILLLCTACGQEESEEYTGQVEEIFSEISVSEELNLYVDGTGEPAEGHYTSNYKNGAIRADLTFSEGMISKGEIFSSDGVLTIRYETENDLMKTSYYAKSSQPRMVTLHGDDLSDQIEFHTWHEDGTRSVKHDQTTSKQWYKNGQLQYKMSIEEEEGNVHGNVVSWYENGQVKSKGYYINDVKHGTFKEWDEEGNITSEQVYDMGELVTEKEQSQ